MSQDYKTHCDWLDYFLKWFLSHKVSTVEVLMWHTLLPQDFHNLKFLIIENTFGETVIQTWNVFSGILRTWTWKCHFEYLKVMTNPFLIFRKLSLLRFTSLPCIFSRGNRKLSFFRLLIFKMSASLKMSIILSRTVEKFAELPFENIWYFRGKAAAAIMLLPTKVWKSNSQHFAIIVVWTLKSAPRVEVKLGTRRELFWWNNKVWGNKIKLEIVQL